MVVAGFHGVGVGVAPVSFGAGVFAAVDSAGSAGAALSLAAGSGAAEVVALGDADGVALTAVAPTALDEAAGGSVGRAVTLFSAWRIIVALMMRIAPMRPAAPKTPMTAAPI